MPQEYRGQYLLGIEVMQLLPQNSYTTKNPQGNVSNTNLNMGYSFTRFLFPLTHLSLSVNLHAKKITNIFI